MMPDPATGMLPGETPAPTVPHPAGPLPMRLLPDGAGVSAGGRLTLAGVDVVELA